MGATMATAMREQPASRPLCAFRDALATHFGIGEVSSPAEDGFRAAITATSLPGMSFVEVRSDPMHLARTRRDVSRLDRGVFSLGLVLDGGATLAQDGREARLGPRDIVLCDSRRPFRMSFDRPFAQLIVDVDAALLAARLPTAERLTATRVDGSRGLAAVTGALLQALGAQANDLGDGEVGVVDRALDLVTLTFGGLAPHSSHDRQLATRVRAYIESNLADPALTSDGIAAAHGISRRTLYRIFEGQDESIGAFVLRRRLERCRAALIDPAQVQRSVTEIALAWGFNNPAHFSRAFRQAFGQSPRALRRGARS